MLASSSVSVSTGVNSAQLTALCMARLNAFAGVSMSSRSSGRNTFFPHVTSTVGYMPPRQ